MITKKTIRATRWRKMRAGWRDTRLLLTQFRWPLLAFCLAILGGGELYFRLARAAQEPLDSPVESMYHVLGLTFLQPSAAFPHAWYLEAFYFVMPLIGIGILAQGVADFGVLFFNRRERGKEWEMAVATTFNKHVILAGLGHLGYRVVCNLHMMNQEVVVIELDPASDLAVSVKQMGVPVLPMDGTREATLEASGVRRARAVVLCTQNDSLNLQMALKARSMNPEIQIVLRIFDDDFAQSLEEQFGFRAMSATGMAAPAFAAAAAGVDMTRPITVEGRSLSLARLTVLTESNLVGLSVGRLEEQYDLSVVLVRRDEQPDLHPSAERLLTAGEVVAVLGGPSQISALIRDNNSVA